MLGRRRLGWRACAAPAGGRLMVTTGSGGSWRDRRFETYKPTATTTLTTAMKAGKSSKKSTISL